MTELAALDRLIEAVEEGLFDIGHPLHFEALPHAAPVRLCASRAYDGSLDAAKALHDALLPGWRWAIWLIRGATVWGDICQQFSADVGCPARSLLLATLKGYRSALTGDKP